MRILITGTNGYIGKSLYNALKDQHEVVAITRAECELTDSAAVDNYFTDTWFDAVIHCAVKGGSRLQEDSYNVMDSNLQMYYNLLKNKAHYGRLIHFGSGAEFTAPTSPYGLSKRVISKSISEQENFYNLRIYAVFDENELDTRFIKANLKRYLNKEPMQIYQDKYMDFIYMQDLVKIINYYLTEKDLPEETGCTYKTSITLLDIANFINTLDNYRVDIQLKNSSERGEGYVNFKKSLSLDYIGLEQGIINTYNILKCNR